MKIAYVYDVIYPFIKGGVEKRIYELSRRLASRHEVHVYGMKFWNGDNIIEQNGVYLHGICKPLKLYNTSGRRSITEAIYFALKILPHLIKEEYDVIDCQESPYFPCFTTKIYSILIKVPLIITWHEVWDDYWYEYLGRKGEIGRIIEKMVTKLTKYNIAVSEKTKRDLENLGLDNIKVIPNGVDFNKIRRIKPSDNNSDIIFVGRLIKEKNVDILLRAIKLIQKDVPDIKCIIIGDGPERRKLENLARSLKLENNTYFLGFLENYEEVISYMKASKIFVLPSTREGFGIAALEANACGLPVITINNDRNAAKDLIKDGVNGFLCELSEREIAEKIIMALKVHDKIKEKCIENARKFDWDIIINEYEKYLYTLQIAKT